MKGGVATKKVSSILLAVLISCSFSSITSFATNTVTRNGRGADVQLQGAVEEGQTLISVVVPLKIESDIITTPVNINDGTELDPEYINQFESMVASTYMFKNYSTCKVNLEITGVKMYEEKTKDGFISYLGEGDEKVPFIGVIDLSLGEVTPSRPDGMSDEDYKALVQDFLDNEIFTQERIFSLNESQYPIPLGELGKIQGENELILELYGRDNEENKTSLTDGDYRVNVQFKVTAILELP